MKYIFTPLVALSLVGCGPNKADIEYVRSLVDIQRDDLNSVCGGKIVFGDYEIEDLKVQKARDKVLGYYKEMEYVSAVIRFHPTSDRYYRVCKTFESHLKGHWKFEELDESILEQAPGQRGYTTSNKMQALARVKYEGVTQVGDEGVAEAFTYTFEFFRHKEGDEWKHTNNGQSVFGRNPYRNFSGIMSEDYAKKSGCVFCDTDGNPDVDGIKRLEERNSFEDECNVLAERMNTCHYYIANLFWIKMNGTKYPRLHNPDDAADAQLQAMWQKFDEVYQQYYPADRRINDHAGRIVDITKIGDPGKLQLEWARLDRQVEMLKKEVANARNEDKRQLTEKLKKLEAAENAAFDANLKASRKLKEAREHNSSVYPDYEKDLAIVQSMRPKVELMYKEYSEAAMLKCQRMRAKFVKYANQLDGLASARCEMLGINIGK